MTDNPRISMLWPKDLKDKVQEVAGPRGLTEFTIAAVEQHLKVAPDFNAVHTELNQTKALVQTLADKLVLGGDSSDRLQSLLEVQFPEWIETVGWPVAFADLVHARRAGETPGIERAAEVPAESAERQAATAHAPEGVALVDEEKITRVTSEERRAAAGQTVQGQVVPEAQLPTEPAPALEVQHPDPTSLVSQTGPGDIPLADKAQVSQARDDLLAKVMKATGQELPSPLVPASTLPTPESKPQVHNHAWERVDGILRCECEAWIDDSDPAYPNGIVRPPGWAPQTSEAADVAPAVGAPAVEPPGPAASERDVMCPNGCGDKLIDGECWTCS